MTLGFRVLAAVILISIAIGMPSGTACGFPPSPSQALRLPTPCCAKLAPGLAVTATFSDTDGTSLNSYTPETGRLSGSAWTIQSGRAVCNPTGTKITYNDGGEVGTTAGWSVYVAAPAEATVSNDGTTYVNGSKSIKLSITNAGSSSSSIQFKHIANGSLFTTLLGRLYRCLFYSKVSSAPGAAIATSLMKDTSPFTQQISSNTISITNTDWPTTKFCLSGIATGGNFTTDSRFNFAMGNRGVFDIWFDDCSVEELDLVSAMAFDNGGYTSGRFSASYTCGVGDMRGIVIGVNSKTAPTQGLFGLYDRLTNKIKLLALTAENTWTSLMDTSVAYSADAQHVILFDAAAMQVSVYYDGTQIGATQDVSAYTWLKTNTLHALFSSGQTANEGFTSCSFAPAAF